MATETEEFRAADLIGSAGVGGNGEKLIATLDYHYPPELQAALLRRPNEDLRGKLNDTIVANVAKIAGADRIAHLEVRGGDVDPDDAYITYAFYDKLGTVVKGAVPWGDRSKTSSQGHVSQRDSVQDSPAARDYLAAKAKADAAAGVTTGTSSGDPIGDYEEMRATDITAYLEANPDRADVVKALELATRGDDARKTIMAWQAPAVEGDAGDDASGDGAAGDGSGAPT